MRYGRVLAIIYVLALLSWYCWERADVGRFVYDDIKEGGFTFTLVDSKTGRLYWFVDDKTNDSGYWREVDSKTGLWADRRYQKVGSTR